MSLLTLDPLPMKEAQEFWRNKARLSPGQFSQLTDEAKTKAFAVSGIAKGDELETVFSSMQKAIDDGISFGDFKKECRTIFEKRGWTGKRAWRVDNIFRTNIQTAYSVGRYREMMEVKDSRPFWRYSAVNDSRTRPTHAAMHGKVFRYDNPFWDKWYPLNGFRCRCGVTTLSQWEIDRDGLTVEEKDPTGKLIEPIDPATGQKLPARLLMPDPGFAYNPGKAQWGQRLPEGEFKRLQSAPDRWTPLVKKGFKDYNRPPAKEVERYKTTERELWPRGDGAVELYKKTLLGRTLKDAVNEPLMMIEDFISHLALDGRERFLPLIEDMLSDPYEIWLQAEREKLTGKVVLRKRYVDFIRIGREKSLLFVAETAKGRWLGWTFLQTGHFDYIDKARTGILIYGKK